MPRGPTFTLTQLLVAVFITAMGAAITIEVIQYSREQSRQTACANNLKQMCLAVHTFYDVHKELVPLATEGNWGWSWALYVETKMSSEPDFEFWQKLHEHGLVKRPGKVHPANNYSRPYLICPTRRQPMLCTDSGLGYPATPTDYAICNSTTDCWAIAGPPYHGEQANGAFRFAQAPIAYSALNFRDFTDGLAHIAYFGEKHLYRKWKLGTTSDLDSACITIGNSPAHFNSITRRMGSADGAQASGDCQPVGLGIFDAHTEGSKIAASFGSWHPGICQFGMADGHVERVRNDLDPVMCGRMIRPDDGKELVLAE